MNLSKSPLIDFLNKITDFEEKKAIFQFLIAAQKPALGKLGGPHEPIHKILAKKLINNSLECEIPKEISNLNNSGDIILDFLANGEKYMMSSHYKILAHSLMVDLQAELYHLQRRENFRLRIPTDLKAYFLIDNEGLSVPIVDLSAGGCKLQFDSGYIIRTKGEILSGKIILPGQEVMPIRGQIKHIHVESKSQIFGIQFLGLSEKDTNRLAALVMELYRQLFAKHY